ncbi:MAG: replicative DNA helicase [Eubacteriales bacterium]|nr:replicative DNA helicase [Eubacteriales bacterium]
MNEAEEKVLNRQAPCNLQAEKSVLGCMLLDKDAMESALGMLRKDDFYSKQYGIMFEAIGHLAASLSADQVVDLVTVQEQLARDGAPNEMQSADFVRDIFDCEPTSVNIKSYAEIVKNKSLERRLIKTCGDIAKRCYDDTDDTETILADTESKIFELLKKENQTDYIPIDEIALNVYNKIQEAARNKDHITGIPTGFTDLDDRTSGLQRSDLIILAARPSMGKTAFALNILEHVGIKKNKPTMIFSLEMSEESLVNRLFAMDSGIDAQSLRNGNLLDSDWARLLETTERIGNSNIIIDATPGIRVSELRSKARKVKLERGLDMIVIDYLQLMSGTGKSGENRQQEVSEISRSLKAIARELQCPVIALSQLSRACESRPDKRPMLSDLRESGGIEQDADVVMFLYRDEYYNPDSEKKGEAELIIAKQRNGPTGTIELLWQPQTTRFVSKLKKKENY